MKKIAIIGAGLSGLTLTKQLTPYANIELFEKSRGVSGRMSTRRAEPFHFDHGAQFFTASDPRFQDFLTPLIEKGIVAQWDARFTEYEGNEVIKQRKWDADFPHYVGAPAMNAINKHVAIGMTTHIGTRITTLEKVTASGDIQWQLFDEHGNNCGIFDWVISTAPAQQTAELMPTAFAHYSHIANTTMNACFSLMLGFNLPLDLDFDAALVKNADISWISVNSSKPQRPEGYTLLVHSTNEWADNHIDDNKDDVIDYLCRQTEHVIGRSLVTATHKGLHGWRYANIEKQPHHAPLIDKSNNLAVCGDWTIKGKVESAFISSKCLGDAMIETLTQNAHG